jgi:hypothetical protein
LNALSLADYLAGGAATRPDSLTGLDPNMQNALLAMFSAAPEDVRSGLRINSAYRSPELQAQLYEAALRRYGSEAEARRWVAPPGRSQHNHGRAVDLGYASDAAREWAHANAAAHGLAFPLSNENWHIELANARGMPASAPQAAPQGDPAPEMGNALAGLQAPPQGAPEGPPMNALMAMDIDPAAFMSRRRFDTAPPDYTRFLRRG